jgi:hypothetical protein
MMDMASKTTKAKRSNRKSEAELRRELERIAPSKETLRRLADKYPPPQKWYDEDTSSNGKH